MQTQFTVGNNSEFSLVPGNGNDVLLNGQSGGVQSFEVSVNITSSIFNS